MNVIAVDVGTTSVRLAIISFTGENFQEATVLASCTQDIQLVQDGLKFEQSSQEIWQAICHCSRECLTRSKLVDNSESIKSIAFSATCSLVIEQDTQHNDVIMWMDHRAIDEAQLVTESQSKVLHQFGGVCSPEFSLAKLLWLKKHEPARFNSASSFFELPDWLVYKCIGGDPTQSPRSLCSVTCKWGYNPDNNEHCDILTNSLDGNALDKISATVSKPGASAGTLSVLAATQLGLWTSDMQSSQDKENRGPFPKISVGTSLIDAHSGMLAMLSVPLTRFNIDLKIETTFCSLAGTSSCHMLLSKQKNFTRGIWGPYKDVVLDGYCLLEAGQSLTGRMIEIAIESHEEGRRRLESGERMYEVIESLNCKLKDSGNHFKQHLHILPTFHGNRSPLANPRLRGGVYGLSAEGPRSLLEYYVATMESILFELRLIIETLGTKLDTILVSGGLMKNRVFMQMMADVLQCRVVKMSIENIDFMVMGSGLVARHAALQSEFEGTRDVTKGQPLKEASIEGINYKQLDISIYNKNIEKLKYYEKRYECYKKFVELSLEIDRILTSS